jgi:hypothetical protein
MGESEWEDNHDSLKKKKREENMQIEKRSKQARPLLPQSMQF